MRGLQIRLSVEPGAGDEPRTADRLRDTKMLYSVRQPARQVTSKESLRHAWPLERPAGGRWRKVSWDGDWKEEEKRQTHRKYESYCDARVHAREGGQSRKVDILGVTDGIEVIGGGVGKWRDDLGHSVSQPLVLVPEDGM